MKAILYFRLIFLVLFFLPTQSKLCATEKDSLQKPPCERCLLLKKGTKIKVKTSAKVSSKDGLIQIVDLYIAENIFPDGEHIIFSKNQSGTAEARIQKPRSFGKPARIELYAINIRTTGKQIVPVMGGEITVTSGNDSGLAIGMGLGLPITCVALGAPPVFLALCITAPLIKGKHITIPAGIEMIVEVARSIWVSY